MTAQVTISAPEPVWSYFRACDEARDLLTPPVGLLDLEVTIANETKRVADLTASDLRALAEAERRSTTIETLARLDRIEPE
jgi:hypothetical protein